MAMLSITLTSGAVTNVDSESVVMTPDGTKTAGDLSEGDYICLFSDGHMSVKIESIA